MATTIFFQIFSGTFNNKNTILIEKCMYFQPMIYLSETGSALKFIPKTLKWASHFYKKCPTKNQLGDMIFGPFHTYFMIFPAKIKLIGICFPVSMSFNTVIER